MSKENLNVHHPGGAWMDDVREEALRLGGKGDQVGLLAWCFVGTNKEMT